MVNDDTAPLAQSAGAAILHIHENAPSSQAEFESWWNLQLNKANTDKHVLVVVNSSSKTCKQLSNWLKQCEHVRYTHAKNIAKAITNNNGEGELLKDTHMETIQKIHDEEPTATGTSVVKPTEDDTVEFINDGNQNESYLGDDNDTEQAMTENTKRTRSQEETIETRNEKPNDEHRPSNLQKRRRRNDSEEVPINKVDRAADIGPVDTEDAAAQTRRKVVDESSDDEPGIPAERIPLPTTEDGWLMAAPRRRKAYRKERDADIEIDAEVPDSAAETEKVSGLIVRQYTQTTSERSRIAQKQQGFKRCKSSVLFMCIIDCSYLFPQMSTRLYHSSTHLSQFVKTVFCVGTRPLTPQGVPIKAIVVIFLESDLSTFYRKNLSVNVSYKNNMRNSNENRNWPISYSVTSAEAAESVVEVVCLIILARVRRSGAEDVVSIVKLRIGHIYTIE